MKSSRNSKSGSSKKRGIRMRTAQKQTINYAVVGASVIGVVAAVFIYSNFFNSSSSRAENAESVYHATYTTTDASVPMRLLLKPEINQRGMANYDYKNDTNHVAKKVGRGQVIAADKYITE